MAAAQSASSHPIPMASAPRSMLEDALAYTSSKKQPSAPTSIAASYSSQPSSGNPPSMHSEDDLTSSSEHAEPLTPIDPVFSHSVTSSTSSQKTVTNTLPQRPKAITVSNPAKPSPKTKISPESTQNSNDYNAPPLKRSQTAGQKITSLFRRSTSKQMVTSTNPSSAQTSGVGTPTPARSPLAGNTPEVSPAQTPGLEGKRNPFASADHSPRASMASTPPEGSIQDGTDCMRFLTGNQEYHFTTTSHPEDQRETGSDPESERPHSATRRQHSDHHLSPNSGGVKFVGIQEQFTRPAAEGVGMKARRLSTSLPGDFDVPSVELYNEFASSSHIPGKRGKVIGSGATSTLKLMCRKGHPNELFAVKEFRKINKEESEYEYEQKVKSEYSISKSLNHPNIVNTVRLCTHSNRWNHVMEYCAQGDLFALVNKKYFNDLDKMCIFKQMLHGVAYLHAHGIAHRDMKLENLLMDSRGHVKITDFGVSEVFTGDHPGLRGVGGRCGQHMGEIRRSAPGICGSKPYIAPEVLAKKGDYDPRAIDIWSCAIIGLQLICGGGLWNEANPETDIAYAKFDASFQRFYLQFPEGEIHDGPNGMPQKLGPAWSFIPLSAWKRLLLKMLHTEPKLRISAQKILEDRWFKGVECCAPVADCEGNVMSEGNGGPQVDASKKGGGCGTKVLKAMRDRATTLQHNHLPPEVRRKATGGHA